MQLCLPLHRLHPSIEALRGLGSQLFWTHHSARYESPQSAYPTPSATVWKMQAETWGLRESVGPPGCFHGSPGASACSRISGSEKQPWPLSQSGLPSRGPGSTCSARLHTLSTNEEPLAAPQVWLLSASHRRESAAWGEVAAAVAVPASIPSRLDNPLVTIQRDAFYSFYPGLLYVLSNGFGSLLVVS